MTKLSTPPSLPIWAAVFKHHAPALATVMMPLATSAARRQAKAQQFWARAMLCMADFSNINCMVAAWLVIF